MPRFEDPIEVSIEKGQQPRRQRSPQVRLLRRQLSSHLQNLVEANRIPTSVAELLREKLPMLAASAIRNVAETNHPFEFTFELLSNALLEHAELVQRHLTRARSRFAPPDRGLLLRARPCCSKRRNIWPFCRAGC
jgi:hypothetical protein